ncbi:MAG: NrfD/PsrC family molybdoenzyme membrane anchor subunit [Anaerolineae bacterium]
MSAYQPKPTKYGRSLPKQAGYYGRPVIKKSHWLWEIIVYFFVGGVAGGSSVVAAVASRFGTEEDEPVVRTGRYLALLGAIVSPILLILDLGIGRRFHHMLRIFKTRSPMSVGSWILAGFGSFTGLAAGVQAARDGLLGVGRLAGLLAAMPGWFMDGMGSLFGFFLSGYTGVLLTGTAIPLWSKAKRYMGPLFLTSALSTAVAAISFILSLGNSTPDSTMEKLKRTEKVALLSELGLLLALKQHLGRTGDPLWNGRHAGLTRFFVGGGLITPLLLHFSSDGLGRRMSRLFTIVSSILVLAGGFAMRYAVIMAGHDSADDPEALFDMQSNSRD